MEPFGDLSKGTPGRTRVSSGECHPRGQAWHLSQEALDG